MTSSCPQPNKLPELCYVFIESNDPGQRIGIIKRGHSGYYVTDYDRPTLDAPVVRQVVDELNNRLGVTKAQVLAMEIGSMQGWDVPGADPATTAKYFR